MDSRLFLGECRLSKIAHVWRAGHGFWTVRSRILDAEEVTDFGRPVGLRVRCWAVKVAMVDEVDRFLFLVTRGALLGWLDGRRLGPRLRFLS
jgi:hypothetical protein